MNGIMLKLFKYFLLGAAFLAAAACSDEGNGAGDATIGFEQATYSFRESEGTVRIPVKFTGEPKSYPITFDIVPSVDSEDGITVDSVARFIQLEHFRYIGDPDAPVYIEIDLLDNDFENESNSKVFFNIPYLDDKKEHEPILDDFLVALGFSRLNSSNSGKAKLFNIFK